MTVDAVACAQSLTQKPVKGMLTGPVTVLNWSFFRKDISEKGKSVSDCSSIKKRAGIKIIQIDEAAFREGGTS
jgi:5-methyltetrahydropteroyltriglutamate--homocysteine methyltransferase